MPETEVAIESSEAQTDAQPAQLLEQPEPLTPQGSEIAAIVSKALTDPEYAKQPDVKPIVDKWNEFQASKKGAEAKEEKSEEVKGKKVTAKSEAVEETDEDDVFHAAEKKSVKFDAEGFPVILKDKFGIDNPDKAIPTFNKWRKDSESLKELTEKHEAQTDFLASLPEPLYNALLAYEKGTDWQESLNAKPSINFEKPFAKQTSKIVKAYFGDTFKDADFDTLENEDGTPNLALKQAITVSENRFEFEKTQYEGTRAEIENRGKERANTLKTSALSSVKNLQETFPEFSDKQLKVVQSEMLSGGVNKMFYNPDGSFTTNAAEMYALAKYGKKVIESTKKSAKVSSDNEKEMKEIEERGAPKKVVSSTPVGIPEEVSNLYKGLGTVSPYESFQPVK